MLKYRGTKLIRAGIIGAVLIALVVAVGLQPQQLINWATTVRYQAVFADAAGLTVGNTVAVSGMDVGTVSDIELGRDGALVTFSADADLQFGSDTTAHIRTGTLLGQRELTLETAGPGTLRPMSLIPLARTFTPYTLTDAVGELSANTAGTDTAAVNNSLDALSATLDQIAPQLGPTFDGLSRISQTLNQRDQALGDLLRSSNAVTEIMAGRSRQVNTLILNADDLVAVLAERRWAIVELLSHVSAVSRELAGLIADNEAELAPSLAKLNAVTQVLQKNRDNIATALPRLAKFQITLGETVANGPYYSAYIPNLDLPPLLQPFLDYAFGFRRGVDAGQPPDDAGPRSEFPFPYNGIPEKPR
ncbi:MCE family protein [Mycolicibacterium bacteremicum]|uniref:Mammalian cell entry protein n=1 Tax=Mycolicibacterium bacteremicum TaxID=564198 RepID=A0A1W9Z4Q0_MYCBA|nr:MCE family protein [Mycolicibacterium bacteremicum]MCV7433789.1 MCE family protein [Mycolicibacterium bacteremicum]ORA07338.1 mammalian cell entry protein [Mycolicibacterium bacteremicum]